MGSESQAEAKARRNRAFGRAFYAFATLAIGALLFLIAPVNVIRCTPSRDCQIEHRVAVFYRAGTEQLSDVTRASVHEDVTTSLSNSSTIRKNYVLLESPSGQTISTDPMSTAVLSCGHVAASLNQFLKSRPKSDYVEWQGEAVIGVSLILAYVSYRFARGAVRSLRPE